MRSFTFQRVPDRSVSGPQACQTYLPVPAAGNSGLANAQSCGSCDVTTSGGSSSVVAQHNSVASQQDVERLRRWSAAGIDVERVLRQSPSPTLKLLSVAVRNTAESCNHSVSDLVGAESLCPAASPPVAPAPVAQSLSSLQRFVAEAKRAVTAAPPQDMQRGRGGRGCFQFRARGGKRRDRAEDDAECARRSGGLRDPDPVFISERNAQPTTALDEAADRTAGTERVSPDIGKAATKLSRKSKAASAKTKSRADTIGGNETTIPKTLFSFGASAGGQVLDGHSTATSHLSSPRPMAVKQPLLSLEGLFEEICAEVDDNERIQAPVIGIVALAADGSQSSFSMALADGGFPSTSAASRSVRSKSFCAAASVASRDTILSSLSSLLISWRGVVYEMTTQDLIVDFLRSLVVRFTEVDVVTFHAPCVYFPLLAAHCEPRQRMELFSQAATWSPWIDVQVMGWMASPSDTCSDFDMLLRGNLATGGAPPSQLLSQFPMTSVQGAVDRLSQLMQLYRKLYAALGSRGLLQPLMRQERHASFLCALMKFDGILVDITKVDDFKQRAVCELDALQQRALKAVAPAMTTFNLQSPDDCRQALYGVLNLDRHLALSGAGGFHDETTGGTAGSALPTLAVTKTGKLSTAEETLKQLAAYHELPQIILEYRRIAKTLQTYVEGVLDDAFHLPKCFPRELQRDDMSRLDACSVDELLLDESLEALRLERMRWNTTLRRIHATFFQQGTDTGRLSCFEPNLQNLPRVVSSPAAEGGARPLASPAVDAAFVRCSFVPHPGCVFVAADFEQIELRVLAHLCGDAALVENLTRSGVDGDIHRSIASCIFRKPPQSITKEERTEAKRVVFGVLYGMGARALAAQLGTTVERASSIQQMFRQAYPQLERYVSRVVSQCRQEDGLVRTITGRMRLLPDISDPSAGARSLAERQAFNTVIQGSAADVVKRAMQRVFLQVLGNPAFGGRITLHCQIHDELVLSVPTQLVHTVVPEIVSAMTSCMSLSVPLRVSVGVGSSLGTLLPYSAEVDYMC